ncbi:MAG: hypothetical protein KAH00_01635 [Cocleimonas sp.]|nr:hypothetical protein [Cocleimonas sp.]
MNDKLYQMNYKLLLPLTEILLSKGVTYSEISQILKQVYVVVTEQKLLKSEGKATTSRIAIITGLTRKDVAALRKVPLEAQSVSAKYNRATRVINGWQEDEEFCTSGGFPAVLVINGKEKSFEALVSRYSGDMTSKAMLDELKSTDTIEIVEGKYASLQRRAYLPMGDEDEVMNILGLDVSLLIKTIGHNMTSEKEELRFQRKVCYDNLPLECLDSFQKMVGEDSQALLEKSNEWLRQYDRDVGHHKEKGSGKKRAGIGIYYFEEDVFEEV